MLLQTLTLLHPRLSPPSRVIYSGRIQLSKIGDNSEMLILFRAGFIKRGRTPKGRFQRGKS